MATVRMVLKQPHSMSAISAPPVNTTLVSDAPHRLRKNIPPTVNALTTSKRKRNLRAANHALVGIHMKRLMLSAAAIIAACIGGCTSEGPPHERVFTDARALVAGPARAVGEDCTNTGKDGCTSGACLKVEPGVPGKYICTSMCAPDGTRPCPLGWSCLQVRPTPDGFACVPPANWQPRATKLETATQRASQSLQVGDAKQPLMAADGGR